MDAQLPADIMNAKYHNIFNSDHSLVELKIYLGSTKPPFSWEFNPSIQYYLINSILLNNDKQFHQQTTKQIAEYVSLNDTTDSTLWEAFKAVMRGHIAYEAKMKLMNVFLNSIKICTPRRLLMLHKSLIFFTLSTYQN